MFIQEIRYGGLPLYFAAENGHEEVVEILMKEGAACTRSTCGLTPLHIAARDGYKGIMELLLNKGGGTVNDIDEEGWTPLHYAAFSGNLEVVKFLIDKGASTHAKNNKRETPLDLARKKEHTEIVNMLSSINTKVTDVSVSQLSIPRKMTV